MNVVTTQTANNMSTNKLPTSCYKSSLAGVQSKCSDQMPHIYGTGELFTVWCARHIYMYFIFSYRNLYTCNYVTMCDHVRSVLQLVYLLHSQWQLQGNDYCPYIH